ncbi:MAG: hypothetical protein JRL30_29085, partial [Deltaproteobacteria bacterium]|nr:hypothetical protein [Deltaproteobacteria bacterium]
TTFNIYTGYNLEQAFGTQLVIFCFRAIETVKHLKESIETSENILSSDAGPAEEYLSQKAEPRRWHVAKTWDGREWANMALDLLGMESQLFQSSIVDQTPYVKAWGGK